ncbi:MAG TPA: alkaline phosphatase family protein [Pyrinomonadaceae bacterium]|jgi:predicted AlkP superfamily pyrophosphatase or phosphodiesterase|nr:alkaline phosphatase family protein [Pyrinomonadaceae bacterium]
MTPRRQPDAEPIFGAHNLLRRAPARRARSFALAALLSLSLAATPPQGATQARRGAAAATDQTAARRSAPAAAARPRLVLLVVVDQFRADYLERFGDLFAQNGLRRLMTRGARWTNANYDHMPTYTAPGHATTMTGTYPAENGIIANDWYDREVGCVVSNVNDPEDKFAPDCRPAQSRWKLFFGGANERASSPRRMTASTLGDELRLSTNDRAKVVGISVKDRSAILPSGRHASAAYWFSTSTGSMVTTDYYFTEPPAWVKNFNDARPADKFFGRKWEYALGSDAEYVRRQGADAPAWENIGNAPGDTNKFPHTVTGGAGAPSTAFYTALDYTPFSNDLLLDFAEAAIDNEGLGADETTDVLTVSFSANDYVGHRYGPYSHEAMDAALRVDVQIGALLDFVDKKIGLQNTLVAFTADHGVAPIPEHAAALGLPGGRIPNADIMSAVRNAVRARFGKAGDKDTTADYVVNTILNGYSTFMNGNVFFNTAALKRDGVERAEAERAACEGALTVPGISRCFTRTQLEAGNIPASDAIARRVLHGFSQRRSGDIVLLQEPFKYLGDGIPATHGSPYSYDTHVPLIIMGAGVAPGDYNQPSTPADLAPTLATLLRVQPPSNATGRVLLEALGGR